MKKYIKTGLVYCPFGITDTNKLRCRVSDNLKSKIEDLSNTWECKFPCIVEYLDLYVNKWTKLFDSNKEPIDITDISTEFTCFLLLEFSKKSKELNINIVQMLVRTLTKLPQGCIIFNNHIDLKKHLNRGESEPEPDPVHIQYGDENEIL